MRDFDRKVEEASARFNKSVANLAEQLEKETAELVAAHLRSLGLEAKTGVAKTGVVALLKGGKPGPLIAVRAHSTKALRTASQKLSEFADYLEQQRRS